MWILAVAACGHGSSSATNPSNREAVPRSSNDLVVKEVQQREVWLLEGREGSLDTNDACCGVAYDGNRYEDALATCAVNDECPAGHAPVYPGIADDKVCGAQRRCVPLPEARVIVEDDTKVVAIDGDGQPLAVGTDRSVAHRRVVIGREGFVTVTIGAHAQSVALDYGARYTIVARAGRIERVTRE